MASCPLCSQPILTYRIRLTSDDELTMCCNENCMYPFHDKDTFHASLVIQKSAKVAKKRKQDAFETDTTQGPIKAMKTTQPPKLITTGPTINKDSVTSPRRAKTATASALTASLHFMPALPNTSSKNSHVAVPPTKATTVASTIYPVLCQSVATTSSTSDPLAFLESVPINPLPKSTNSSSSSSLSSPTALPPLSAASSPDMSLDFLDSDPWIMPTTPPSMIQTMNQLKQPDISSSMTDQSIRDLLFDDFDAGSDLAQMPDFGSLMLDLDDTSLDAFLGGLPSM
ncbi:hypothetical protein BG006_000866 [Podila minutissima]|uniref:Uncharacterized protein n=1 Tax=Podila minutissima TaxID=64525 RepID=A0A9P5VH14_9FUNG|nr:hypothetical protein BG006_000866 [Podila minutissima]